jgi:hypothetical protein
VKRNSYWHKTVLTRIRGKLCYIPAWTIRKRPLNSIPVQLTGYPCSKPDAANRVVQEMQILASPM